MIYGISTHIVARETLLEEHLDMITDAGFDTVELFANRHQIDFDNPSQLRSIARGIDRNRLYVNSVHAPFYGSLEEIQKGIHLDIASADPALRERSVNEIAASFVLGTLFEVDYYVLHTPDRPDTDALMKSLDELLTLSHELPFKLCFENIPGEQTDLNHIMELVETNMLPIGVCFDTGHSNLAGDAGADIRKHGVHFYTTHIHDNDGQADAHLMPFTGTIDWMDAMRAFREVDYKWGFILEVRRPQDSPLSAFLTKCRQLIDRFQEMKKGLR